MLIGRKTWPPEGRGLFALYGYSENLKNLLQKCQADFQIIL